RMLRHTVIACCGRPWSRYAIATERYSSIASSRRPASWSAPATITRSPRLSGSSRSRFSSSLSLLIQRRACSYHDGVSDTCALNVIAGELVGNAHLLATVRMQLSNVSPSEGAKFELLNWPDGAKLADTDSVTVLACRPVFFLSACS